jgi:hypothetical protein
MNWGTWLYCFTYYRGVAEKFSRHPGCRQCWNKTIFFIGHILNVAAVASVLWQVDEEWSLFNDPKVYTTCLAPSVFYQLVALLFMTNATTTIRREIRRNPIRGFVLNDLKIRIH